MTLRCTVLLAFLSAACAAAGGGAGIGDDSNGDDGNSGDDGPADARTDTSSNDAIPPIDAAGPTTETLTQTTSPAPTGSNSLVCQITANGTTPENSWYRIYRLADLGITGAFTVSRVTFGVAIATGAPIATIKIGTYTPSVATPPAMLDTAQITPISMVTYTQTADVASTAPITVEVPIAAVIPAGAQLIVEVTAPDYSNTKKFWIAGNTGGEMKPSWWRAPTCSRTQPVTTATAGFGGSHIPIIVTGTHQP